MDAKVSNRSLRMNDINGISIDMLAVHNLVENAFAKVYDVT